MSKAQGDIAESVFATRCLMKGLNVLIPFGDNGKYDIMTEHNGRTCRIQVKCTNYKQKTDRFDIYYKVNSAHGGGSKKRYSKAYIDYIAAFVIPEQMWYIVPVEEVTGLTMNLFPNKENSEGKYEKFKNKFSLLLGEDLDDKDSSQDDENIVKNFEAGMSKFSEDLKFGNKGEKIYMAYLMTQGAKNFTTNDTDSHDIKCDFNGKELLFEVKYDRYESDNIVIEFFDGRRLKNTGNLVTKADYYVTIFKEYGEIWSIKADKLLDILFNSGSKYNVIWGGDDSKTMMFKIRKDKIKEHFTIKYIDIKKT